MVENILFWRPRSVRQINNQQIEDSNMNDLTMKQKIAVWALSFFCLSTIFIIGYILNALMYMIILFGVFAIINTLMEFIGKKTHAPAISKIPAFIMCYCMSCFLLLMCVLVIKITTNTVPEWQAVILGIIIIGFSCLSISNAFYFKPKGSPSKYQRELDFVKHNPINSNLLAFENMLKSENNLDYLVYRYIFKDQITWKEASELLDMETCRIVPIADKIAFGLRSACLI